MPATVGRRFGNFFIDMVGLYIWSFVLGLIIGFVLALAGLGNIAALVGGILGIFFYPLYYLFFEGIWQKTPGKWLTKTKVVMEDGSKPDFLHILGRSFARWIPFEALSFLFSGHPVGWHDRLSRTLVVPAHYSPEDVRRIDLAAAKKSSTSVIIIIIVLFFVGIAVVGLLSSIVLASLNTARIMGRDARRVADVKELQLGLELYYDANGSYPSSLDALAPTYISTLPTDPASQTPYDYHACSASTYHLGASLEGNTNAALAGDADVSSMCAGDTVNGSDTGPCSLGDAGDACYDVTS
jgi:uncharacterized RDD family membrane protein YckC/type II secretory pathway pseudopilin PulG